MCVVLIYIHCAGKYYLADARYGLSHNFITPYQHTRHHLQEFRGQCPINGKELFNLWHTFLCNAIARAFGVLKKKVWHSL